MKRASDTVLIVGAGPVGLAAAVELTRRGVPVRLIERGEALTSPDQSRALAVQPLTLTALAASGVTQSLLGKGRRIERMTLAWNGRDAATLDLAAAGGDYPFMLALSQGETERVLAAWLDAKGVAIEWSAALVGLETTHAPVAVLSAGERLACGAVLGCDGARSSLREILDIPWRGDGYPTGFALADVTYSRPTPRDTAKAAIASDGTTRGLIPFGNDRMRVIGMAETPDRLLADETDVAKVHWTSEFRIAFRRAARLNTGRAFLAGDAAHLHSPIGGRGMNLGIQDAATFAYLFAAGRETEYEMRRLPAIDRTLDETRRMTDFVTRPPRFAGPALRFALPVAFATPGVRHRIARRVLGLNGPEAAWLASEVAP